MVAHPKLFFFTKALIVFLSGTVLAFTQAPHNFWFLIFLCFSIFYYIYSGLSRKRAVFFISFLFSLGYFTFGLNWIGNALLVEGNDYKWAWPLAVTALPMGLSLFSSTFLTIAHKLTHRGSLNSFFAFTIFLALAEFVRGYAFTGFPWNLFAYTWVDQPIAQMVSIFGPYSLTWFTIFWGASFGMLAINKQNGIILLSFSALTLSLFWGFGAYKLNANPTLFDKSSRFAVVQPNIAQVDKWNPQLRDNNFLKHINLSTFDKKAEKNIIIWPETSVPPALLNSDIAKEKFDSLTDQNTILLTGGLGVYPEENSNQLGYHNALFSFQAGVGPHRLYSKTHLVPFGEYIPFQKYIPLTPITNFSGLTPGDGVQTVKINDFPSFSPQICYEIIFPNAMTHPDDVRPDYILTITNDAWYGDSAGPYQHFDQARFRAIEQGIPVVRAANTGVSGVIDPMGRIIEQRGLMTEATINTYLPLKIAATPYSIFQEAFFLIFIILSIGWTVLRGIRSPKQR